MERRRGLLKLSGDVVKDVLQQFVVSRSATGEAIAVTAVDVARVSANLLSDAGLVDVLKPLMRASLRGGGGEQGSDWWRSRVDEFVGATFARVFCW
jgi:hypothetical protein